MARQCTGFRSLAFRGGDGGLVTKMSRCLLVAAGTLALGCRAPEPSSQDAAAQTGREVGESCTSADGYQPGSTSSACPPSDAPVACPPPTGYVDFHQLPPGVGYCLSPGGQVDP